MERRLLSLISLVLIVIESNKSLFKKMFIYKPIKIWNEPPLIYTIYGVKKELMGVIKNNLSWLIDNTKRE